MIIRHILGSDKQTGFYVDVGAYHPSQGSNTYFFYCYGWQGINIEARPGSKALFDKVRPRDINLEIGISPHKGELTYHVIDEASPMNSFSKEFIDKMRLSHLVKYEVKVPAIPLLEVLESYISPNKTIDFMSVDVEGYDLYVLKSNDWNRFRPNLVIVEDSCIDPLKSEIVTFMSSVGYTVCAQNTIVLDVVSEYFFIEESYRKHYWDKHK